MFVSLDPAFNADLLARVGCSHIPFGVPVDLVYPFFQKPTSWPSTHHIHLCVLGSEHERRHIVFRDYLRSHPTVAAECCEIKRNLAAAHEPSERQASGRPAGQLALRHVQLPVRWSS